MFGRKAVDIRWSDMDPNFHLRHSVYYDLCANSRINFLNDHGFTPDVLIEKQVGPILFREECIFKREIRFTDHIEIDLQLQKCKRDGSRWTMMHQIWKNHTILSAVITIDGAWIDIRKRKLTLPPDGVVTAFTEIAKSEDFTWID